MSKNRKTRYFDFIYRHEERLNLIYRRWEEQIARQSAASKSKSLLNQIARKKTAIAGMAIALCSAAVACQFGAGKVAAWQQNRQLNAKRSLIASNSQKLDQIALELTSAAAYNNRLLCIQSGDVYELSLGRFSNHALANEPRTFIPQPNTVSLIRNSVVTRRPDAYIRLNPHHNLLFGSIEETDHDLKTESSLIDLDQDPVDLPLDEEGINNYAEVQTKAIALHEELSSCLGDISLLPQIPQFPYAD